MHAGEQSTVGTLSPTFAGQWDWPVSARRGASAVVRESGEEEGGGGKGRGGALGEEEGEGRGRERNQAVRRYVSTG